MTITLGDATLSIDDLVRVARDRATVELAPTVRTRLAAARDVVDKLAQSDVPIYGLNTALGANTGEPVADDDLAEYQRRAVRARAVGVGPAYDTTSVRAMLFARAAGMRVGGSGVSPQVLDALVELLNRRVHPVVPRFGSISAADLPQLSHLVLPLLGEGEAELDGERLPGAEAMRRAGLAPLALGAKDGLALISANAASVGRGALVLDETRALLDAWLSVIALSFEGFRGNVSALDARAIAARPAPGQIDVARRLRALLDASLLFTRGAARRVQDPLSFRCVAQVHGAAHWMLGEARGQIETELNSAADSPLVLADDGVLISNGNFHIPALALAFDALALALAQVTALAAGRTIKFMSPAFTGLPLQLTRRGPAHSGFAATQKTLTALGNEIRLRANPASLDFLPVSEGIEDHAPMALACVEKLAEGIERARYVAALELMVAAQAVDLRELDPVSIGAGARAAYRALRTRVAMLDEDRPLGPDIERAQRMLRDGLGRPA